jgi:hypothetical protein
MLVERHFATRPTRRKDGKKKEVAV